MLKLDKKKCQKVASQVYDGRCALLYMIYKKIPLFEKFTTNQNKNENMNITWKQYYNIHFAVTYCLETEFLTGLPQSQHNSD